MTTTVEALQNFYVARGGAFADVENITTIPDMINMIALLDAEQETPISSGEVQEIINSIN